ncbi:DUF2953 domain-containing protein [Paenibacillus sp. GCM10023252]|uniref:DUF2953 domain-containing protein n=1 Tax=Paenibacillus sp. GCM10023252 TaxID=3252649 RepID=UPI00361B7FE9
MFSYPHGWIGMTAAGLFFLLIFALIAGSKVNIRSHIKRDGSNDDIVIHVNALYGAVKRTIHIPLVRFTGRAVELKQEVKNGLGSGVTEKNDEIDANKVANALEKMKQVVILTQNLTGIARRTLAKVSLTEWEWKTAVGSGDAMWTAMATGAVWSMKTTLIGLLSQLLKLKTEPAVQVQPDYNKSGFSTEWSCTASIRLGSAMLAGLQFVARMKKSKQDLAAWRNVMRAQAGS